ncbi:4-(cytidine 5'-diphospho)-2-C-methyl-D-erythritol kinase [Chloroflexota bacterium]
MLIIPAPAKINLTLEVLGRRPDGFHEIRSVVQTIALCDTFSFEPGQDIEFCCANTGWVATQSLVTKAVALLQKTTACSKGAIINVDKRIPLASGLGGDSSDAAAILRGLNQLWELGLSRESLFGLASQLGSDVPFFLHGGTALLQGRGEVVTPLPPLPHTWVILVNPSIPRMQGKTKQLYDSLKTAHYTDGQINGRLIEALEAGKGFTPSLLFNTFENVAFAHFAGLSVYRSHIGKVGATNVHLTGSGPALFTLVEDRNEAEDLCTRLQQQSMETYLVGTQAAVENSG